MIARIKLTVMRVIVLRLLMLWEALSYAQNVRKPPAPSEECLCVCPLIEILCHRSAMPHRLCCIKVRVKTSVSVPLERHI